MPDRNPCVAFLALRHWKKLAKDARPWLRKEYVLDDICGAIAGLPWEDVEWEHINQAPEKDEHDSDRITMQGRLRLLETVMRYVVVARRSVVD